MSPEGWMGRHVCSVHSVQLKQTEARILLRILRKPQEEHRGRGHFKKYLRIVEKEGSDPNARQWDE